MIDCTEITDDEIVFSDPRVSDRFLRCLPRTDDRGAVLLVGVVHDHPASVFRVASILETVSPDILAVELPPLALSLFEFYARDQYTPPRLGGEMSMALQQAGTAETVGLDGPNRTYLRLLVRELVAERVSGDVLETVIRDVAGGLGHALACRLGALVGRLTAVRLRLYSHIQYDTSLLDTPAEQATDEISHVDQRQAFLRAIEIPLAIQLVDRAREAAMVATLQRLRADGDIVAVVGTEHLDALDSQLRSTRSGPRDSE